MPFGMARLGRNGVAAVGSHRRFVPSGFRTTCGEPRPQTNCGCSKQLRQYTNAYLRKDFPSNGVPQPLRSPA